MTDHHSLPIRLYLPLLAHDQSDVRRHTRVLLFSMYGMRALSSLRRMLNDPDPQIRAQVRAALLGIAEEEDIIVKNEQFDGMYIECLGTLRVYIANKLVQPDAWVQNDGGRAGAQKVRAVFAYLLHCGRRGTSRAALYEAVWGQSYRAASLSRVLSTLRQMLIECGGVTFAAQALVVTDSHCILVTDTYTTDLALFERTFEHAYQTEHAYSLDAAVQQYTQAIELYSGLYMADVVSGADWYQERRDQVTNSFVIANERLAEHAYIHKQYRHCLRFCQHALTIDPSDEHTTIWTMRAYHALHQHADVEYVYHQYLHLTEVDPKSSEGQNDLVIIAHRAMIALIEKSVGT